MLLSKSMHVHNQLQALAPCQIACMPMLNCIHVHAQFLCMFMIIACIPMFNYMHVHAQFSCMFMLNFHACPCSITCMFTFNSIHVYVQLHASTCPIPQICPMFTFVHDCVQWIVFPCVWIPCMPMYDDVFVHVSMHAHFQIPSFSCNDLLISGPFCQHQSYLHLHIWRWNSLAIFRFAMAKDWTAKKCLQDETWSVGVSL